MFLVRAEGGCLCIELIINFQCVIIHCIMTCVHNCNTMMKECEATIEPVFSSLAQLSGFLARCVFIALNALHAST